MTIEPPLKINSELGNPLTNSVNRLALGSGPYMSFRHAQEVMAILRSVDPSTRRGNWLRTSW